MPNRFIDWRINFPKGELWVRQNKLRKARLQLEADLAVYEVEPVDLQIVKRYAQDLMSLLKEAELSERKAFLRSFVKRIEVKKRTGYRLLQLAPAVRKPA